MASQGKRWGGVDTFMSGAGVFLFLVGLICLGFNIATDYRLFDPWQVYVLVMVVSGGLVGYSAWLRSQQ